MAKHLNPSGGIVTHCSDDAGCETLNCAVCLKEVPADAISLTDAQDYVLHFCGLDCLETWRKEAALRRKQSGPGRP